MVDMTPSAESAAAFSVEDEHRRVLEAQVAAARTQITAQPSSASEVLENLELTGADLREHGSSLIVTLANGIVIVVRDYFAGPDLALPDDLVPPGGQIFHLQPRAFDVFVTAYEAAVAPKGQIGEEEDLDDEDLEDFDTAAGDSEEAAVLAQLLEEDPELAQLMISAGLGGLVNALGIDEQVIGEAGKRISVTSPVIGEGNTVLIGSAGEDDLLQGPQWTLFASFIEPPADSNAAIILPPPIRLLTNVPVVGLLNGSYPFVLSKGNSGVRFVGDTSNDFDRTGDAVADPDFVQFIDPHNFYHKFHTGSPVETLSIDDNREIEFSIDGRSRPDGATFDFFVPDARHIMQLYTALNTNITQFELIGPSGSTTSFTQTQAASDHYALPGARNPDILLFSAGFNDIDTVSFYDPADPDGGDGDYDFVTPFDVVRGNDPATEADNVVEQIAPFSRISGVDFIEARGFGVNDVVLNKASVVAIAQARDFGGGVFVDSLELAGDPVDSVTLTDEADWRYASTIDAPLQDIVVGDPPNQQAFQIPSTVDNIGNVQYQFVHVDGDAFVNVSASFGDHPDWFWTEGTAGDDLLELPDEEFGNVAFGGGTDTLVLTAFLWTGTEYNQSIDFNFVGRGGGISGVEVISTEDGEGADTMTVDQAFVDAATDAGNTLTLIGDDEDRVIVDDLMTNWTFNGTVNGAAGRGGQFNQYVNVPDGSVLNVEQALAADLGLYFNGWGADDLFTFADLSEFDGIDGSLDGNTTDFDTLQLTNGANPDLAADSGKLRNLEALDLAGNGNDNTATFSADAVRAITDSDNRFLVLGDAGDSVALTDLATWNYVGYLDAAGDLPALNVLSASSGGETVQLSVDADLDIPRATATGTGGDDDFRLPFGDIADVDGGGGFDRLLLPMGGDEDFTTGATVTAVELIDTDNGAANTVTLDAAQAASADNRSLTLIGDDGDELVLADLADWSYVGYLDAAGGLPALNVFSAQPGGQAVQLSVDADITVPRTATAGTNGDDSFTLAFGDIADVDGGDGFDSLLVAMAGAEDFTSGASVASIEAIDTTNGGANAVTVGAELAASAQDRTLRVTGDAEDSLAFAAGETWTDDGPVEEGGITYTSYSSTAQDNDPVTILVGPNLV